MCAVGRERDITVQDGFTQLFGQLLYALGCKRHGEKKSQKKMLHPVILTKAERSDKETQIRKGGL
jgi:hypothetical protein